MASLSDLTIAFLGGGNMAKALIGGILASGVDPSHIQVSDPFPQALEGINQKFPGVQTFSDNADAWSGADVIVFAVKPDIIKTLCDELCSAFSPSDMPLIISIAAGVRGVDIVKWLGYHQSVIRVMPNTPALIGEGATGMWAANGVTKEEKYVAEQMFGGVGIATWIGEDEKILDVVTAISGSGPAYYFLFLECMISAGIKMGLTEEQANILAKQTALGAAKMACESEDPIHVLRQRVTSPHGTTEAAINSFQNNGLLDLVEMATASARDRGEEIGEELSKQ